ncbi:MAG: Asp-tRNA(Asn)/Glu-tRNA(Gln) amidotransferase subunit GatB [Candidatus Nanohaloarchaea archaeon]|nr:Asp-tRNA(Asn)/Glu-tRNA(Gln) amidotransferase subunit GatB [Candidatus Nanohaloarchaea archaeon]
MEGVKIGLETHVQLDTDTKLFCGCTASIEGEPNTHTCEICLGMPGSKPRTNSLVVDYALKACLALNCDVNEAVRFSRKTYFYPDMAKNFQITQYELPVGEDGTVRTRLQGEEQEIGIRRIHIEEDPARLVHKGGDIASADYTLVDYNRAGIPLLEVVTEPDFESPSEARAFLQKLTRIMEYLGIYDPSSDLSIKSDANISLEGGARVEVKNITGTRGIEQALKYEITRQRNLRKRGREVERETRAYSSAQEITTSLREKEMEEDYGYIFEPDLTVIDVGEEQKERMASQLPELPDQKFDRFREEYGLSPKLVEALITDPRLAEDFERLAAEFDQEMVASWMTDELKETLHFNDVDYASICGDGDLVEGLAYLFERVGSDELSDRTAELLLRGLVDALMRREGLGKTREDADLVRFDLDDAEVEETLDAVIDDRDLSKSGGAEIADTVDTVVEEHPDAVDDYREGKDEAINFLVGQVMQRTGGTADPKQARELVRDRLDEA